MKRSDLLVEIGTEEIPAWMLESAARGFSVLMVESLRANRLESGEATTWHTPRRLILWLRDIPEKQPDLVETVIGPPKGVAYDSAGAPTRAAVAFAEKNGIPVSSLRLAQTPKGEYLSAMRTARGFLTRKLLEQLIPQAISQIQFQKSMYWSPDKFRFARPIRWIVALFGSSVVRFSVADVTSAGCTSGHRFLGKERIKVSSAQEMQKLLRGNGVIVEPAKRRSMIKAGLEKLAKRVNGLLVDDSELLETVVNLNEYPTVIRGSFDPKFLKLPKEILVTVMREHQKYFSLQDVKQRLLPHFLAVINHKRDPHGEIRKGHERVLKARLADAAFFWETDRKKPLGARLESLRNVVFQEKLGSYYDKTQRILALVPKLAAAVDQGYLLGELLDAARLAKCDLVTEMVKEFPDLQGVVGGLYAKDEGYSGNVCGAIYKQYEPKTTTSPIPGPSARTLSLADRLDTICGCFTVGLIPSGSRDPFGVRRQANGLLKIVLEWQTKAQPRGDRKIQFSLKEMIAWGVSLFPQAPANVEAELLGFFEGRLRFLMEEAGLSYDSINAAIAVGFDDPIDAMQRARALQGMRSDPDFLAVASNFKRIKNILAQAGLASFAVPSLDLMSEPAERDLWTAYESARPRVEDARNSGDFVTSLRAMAAMRPAVDRFFDKVLVMEKDSSVRQNRLDLLHRIDALFRTVADISEMVIEKSADKGTDSR